MRKIKNIQKKDQIILKYIVLIKMKEKATSKYSQAYPSQEDADSGATNRVNNQHHKQWGVDAKKNVTERYQIHCRIK